MTVLWRQQIWYRSVHPTRKTRRHNLRPWTIGFC